MSGHRWSHCPLLDILRDWNNDPHQRADGRWSSGHEPVHSSSSGTCLSVDTEQNLWFCSSCEQGGGPLALVTGIFDNRVAARVWLTRRFGKPAVTRQQRRYAARHWTVAL
jgi:hypothetical protein